MKDTDFLLLKVIWMILIFATPAATQANMNCYQSNGLASDCKYKCHCTNNNDCATGTGQCTGGSTCTKGWFGPACQYADLMYTDSADSTPQFLRDSNDTTCNPNSDSQTVTVILQEDFPFTWLRLVIKDTNLELLRSINVQLQGQPNSGTATCNNMRIIPANSKILDVYCDGNVAVQSVTITGEGVGYLCSVYFSGGRNIALNEVTSQSSTRSDLTSLYGPQNAVDGNTDGNNIESTSTCTHTEDNGNDNDATWRVTFSQTRIISRYVLYNRLLQNINLNCCRNRLKGFTLTSYTTTNTEVFTYQDQIPEPQAVYTVTTEEITTPVSYVVIKAKRSREEDKTPVLTLCEVEIFGDSVCSAGMYGFECTETCDYCSTEQDTCEVSTGACLSGCGPGLYGERCKQDCPATYYGSDCKDRCSKNCLNQLCDKVTGACLNCAAGKQGISCEQVCPEKTYGAGCKNTCRADCVDQLCDPANGICNNCESGKKGEQCTEECESKTYGPRCIYNCSSNCEGQLCKADTGNCVSCIPGKMEEKCDKDCNPGYYGKNCSYACSTNCRDKHCEPANGECIGGCKDGYYSGKVCDRVCINGTYGKNCESKCSTNCSIPLPGARLCHHDSGNCTNGCQGDFVEPLCVSLTKAAVGTGTSGGDSIPLAPIIGAVVGGVVLVVLIVAGIFLWRRRTRNNNETPNTNNNKAKKASGPRMKYNSSSSRSELIQETQPYDTIGNPDSPDTADGNTATTSGKPELPAKPKKIVKSSESRENKSKIPKPGAYYNAPIADRGSDTLIAVKDLDTFIKTQPKSFYVKQFKDIPDNKSATTKDGESDENRAKNRYKNICAYDHSRVHLRINKAKKHGDYINASSLKGYKNETFIASQAPTKLIMEDFVRMLWEHNIEIVVMLTNLIEQGKQKCEQYWPDEGETRIGEIKIEITTTDIFADYTIRRLFLSKNNEDGHMLTQFHFTSWPDKDVPTTPWGLVDFEQRVASYSTDAPIVVHCSAGVGRTGTFIALRNVMREAEDTGYVDFFTTVEKLRLDRVNMVQTAEQYEFLHRAAQVAIICMGTTVTSTDIQKRIAKLETTSSSGETFMEREFKAICATCAEEDDAENGETSDTQDVSNYENSNVANKLKDRLRNVPAKENYRVRLNCENNDVGNYINAVFVPSFIKDDGQLLTQLPLPTTVTDFWRLVTQYKVFLAVAFEGDLKATDSSVGEYLPRSQDETLEVPLFKVTVGSLTAGDVFEEQKIIVSADEITPRRESVPGFLEGKHSLTHLKARQVDLTPDNLLAMIKQIRSHSRGNNGRTVFLCRNGATYSGLVCVLTLLLDRMDHDLRLTVPLVVGAIKSIRPQVIPTLEQYKLLYQVLHLYNETNNVYGNFGQSTGGDAGASASNRGADKSDKDNGGTVYANLTSC